MAPLSHFQPTEIAAGASLAAPIAATAVAIPPKAVTAALESKEAPAASAAKTNELVEIKEKKQYHDQYKIS